MAKRHQVGGAGALLALALIAGCGSPAEKAAGRLAPDRAEASTPAAAAVTTRWSVADGAQLAPYGRVAVTAVDGRVAALLVTDDSGGKVPSSAGRSAMLPPGRQYTVTATVVNTDGGGVRTESRTVSTQPVTSQLAATVSPAAGSTVGVGEPLQVTLSHPAATRAERAAVERRLTVTTSRTTGPANWYWLSDTRLAYRPATYWPANTTVTLAAKLTGVRTGAQTYGVADTTTSFTVGRSQLLRIDDATHQMQVVRDGQVIRTVPVSMGQPIGTWETRSGIKTIMSVERTVRMNSATVGLTGKGAYDQIVPYAMRLTWSGEYIHAAPWSEWAQGSTNVSHGCVNVSLAHAEWLFGNSLVGDVVETVGTNRAMEPDGNGAGGLWNIPYAKWRTGSAL